MNAARWAAALAVALVAPAPASAQLAEAVRDTPNGVVRFHYDARPGVEVCDEGLRMGDQQVWWRSHGWGDRPDNCRRGVLEVEVATRDGRVRDVEVVTREGERSRDAYDLGRVSAALAHGWLLSLARNGATTDAAEDAVLPAMLADVPEAWRDVLEIARDRALPSDVREQALFWVGQEAADAAAQELSDVAMDRAEDQDVRNAAVFALSQRDPDEAIPTLMDVASEAEHEETRRKAMFWLAQHDDPRVVDFFTEILLGRVR